MNNPYIQLKEFIICVFIGVSSGIIYEFLSLIFMFLNAKTTDKSPSKLQTNAFKVDSNDVIKIIKQILYFCLSAFYFKWLTFLFYLSTPREYMYLGFLVGIYCFYKSFHKAFAILNKLLYNGIIKLLNLIISLIKNTLTKLRKNWYERRKKAQSSVGGGVGRNNATIYFGSNSRVPTYRHRRKAK